MSCKSCKPKWMQTFSHNYYSIHPSLCLVSIHTVTKLSFQPQPHQRLKWIHETSLLKSNFMTWIFPKILGQDKEMIFFLEGGFSNSGGEFIKRAHRSIRVGVTSKKQYKEREKERKRKRRKRRPGLTRKAIYSNGMKPLRNGKIGM